MVGKSKGEYVVCLTDDNIFLNSFDLVIDWLDSFEDKLKISSLTPSDSPICENPIHGQVLGDTPIDFFCEKYPLIRFPVFHKSVLSLLDGVIFNEEFFYHAGDIWLGFYLGKKGYKFEISPTLIGPKNAQKNSTYEVEDCIKCRNLIKLMMGETIRYNKKL
jgi:hypothetical protein